MKRYEAYNINTQETIATADSIKELSEKIYVSRQSISKAIQQNIIREYSPKKFAGGVVVRDTWTTERCQALTKPSKDDNKLYHIYKASTGEYITSLTLSEIYNKLRMKRMCVIYTAIDNHPLYKYNVTITREKHAEPYFLPNARNVYEMFDSNKTLVLSTFAPELIKWWGSPDWVPNPYKPYHYMAFLNRPNPMPKSARKYYYDYDVADKLKLDNADDV